MLENWRLHTHHNFIGDPDHNFTMDETALRGLDPSSDPQAQTRALHYFEQLKNVCDGWRLCAEAFNTNAYRNNDPVNFFCLQVIENYLKVSYSNASVLDQQMLRSVIGKYLQHQVSTNGIEDRTFVRNKLAQVTSLAFVIDYPNRWPSFFADLLQSLSERSSSVDIYLRILLAIHTEVVDRDIVRTQEEVDRNTKIKDHMRDDCVGQLAESWYQIMTCFESSHPELTCMCLEVVGKYISWIDINLIVNDKFVSSLINYMSMALIRESACDCIHDIINKGMDPVAKTKLVESFTVVLESQGVLNPSEDEEGDFLAKLSRLVNVIGVSLIQSLQKLKESKIPDAESADMILQALENKVPLMFRFLGDEDDDVSGNVTGFSQEYINLLKQMKPLSPKQKQNVEGLLYTVIKKMKYDDSYNFEHEGEDEAMFQEYRKQLKTIFNNLAALDEDLILMTVQTVVTQTLTQWESRSLSDIEVAIYLMYIIGEALPDLLQATQSQYFSGDPNKVSALQEMMRILVASRVSCNGHQCVMLQFFETIVRYDRFFNCEPHHIPDVLMAFTDERGFHHQSAQVRSRTSYLFSRFVKSLRSHMNNYLEDILKRVQDLLVLNTPDNGFQHLLSSDDQLFIYETAGSLIVSSSLEPGKKHDLIKELLSPIASKFESLLSKLAAETDENRQLSYAQSISTATAFASRVSKGFSNQQTMQSCGCVDIFINLLQLFLQALNVPVHRTLIQTGVRQYLHRMVVCLDKDILPFVPIVLGNLLKQPNARELHDFIPLMNQLIMKYKKPICPFLQEMFMPLVSTIYQVLSTPTDDGDQDLEEEQKLLRRSYFLFVSTVVGNDCLDVLKTQDVQNLLQILLTIVQGAVEIPDPPSQKLCYSILKKLIEVWGSDDGIPGFLEFIYKNIVPACFMGPLKTTFDLSDGQTSLALNECAQCLKMVYEKRGDEFIQYLQQEYFPTLQLSQEQAQEFCQAMQSEGKTFRVYYKTFFSKAKS